MWWLYVVIVPVLFNAKRSGPPAGVGMILPVKGHESDEKGLCMDAPLRPRESLTNGT